MYSIRLSFFNGHDYFQPTAHSLAPSYSSTLFLKIYFGQYFHNDFFLSFHRRLPVRGSGSCSSTFPLFPVSGHSSLMFQAFGSLLAVSFHRNFGLPLERFSSIFILTTGVFCLFSIYTTKIEGVVCPPNISETVAVRTMKLTHRPRIASTTIKLISKPILLPIL